MADHWTDDHEKRARELAFAAECLASQATTDDEGQDVIIRAIRAFAEPLLDELATVRGEARIRGKLDKLAEHMGSDSASLFAEIERLTAELATRHAQIAELVETVHAADLRAAPPAGGGEGLVAKLIAWVDERWNAEVKHRPTVNIYRETLDITWRQMKRKLESLQEPSLPPEPKLITVIVNGVKTEVTWTEATYDNILQLEGHRANHVLSVVYSRGPTEKPTGQMYPGCKPVRLVDGMVFSVADTSNA